jgi:hypothetical protein
MTLSNPSSDSPYRQPPEARKWWWVIAQQSPFLPEFVLGQYADTWWERILAFFAARWYVLNHPYGYAEVIKAVHVEDGVRDYRDWVAPKKRLPAEFR